MRRGKKQIWVDVGFHEELKATAALNNKTILELTRELADDELELTRGFKKRKRDTIDFGF